MRAELVRRRAFITSAVFTVLSLLTFSAWLGANDIFVEGCDSGDPVTNLNLPYVVGALAGLAALCAMVLMIWGVTREIRRRNRSGFVLMLAGASVILWAGLMWALCVRLQHLSC